MKQKKRYKTKPLQADTIFRIESQVLSLADNVAPEGFFILSVTMEEDHGRWYLRLYMDHPEGSAKVTLTVCQSFSQALSPLIDEQVTELNDFPYCLEVSSPGLFRELQTSREFNFYQGKRIEIKTKGQEPCLASLKHFNPDTGEVTYQPTDEHLEEQCVPLKQLSITLAPDIDLSTDPMTTE